MKASLLACLAAATAALVLAGFVASQPPASADTIELRRGGVIHGEVVESSNGPDRVQVRFANGGTMYLGKEDIVRVLKNDLDAFVPRDEAAEGAPAPSADRPLVRVRLKSDSSFYGEGIYVGHESAASTDETLILSLEGGGELRVPRSTVESIEAAKDTDAVIRPAIESRRIATSHIVELKNGRKLRGDLVETPEGQPLELRLGGLGLLRIEREKIESVQAVADEYEVPETDAEAAEARVEPATAEPLDIEALREEIRREILHEILDELLGGKIEEAIDAAALESQFGLPVAELPAERILEIQHWVRELGRQRTPNRVRAENQLKNLGPDVLGYLAPAATHPFELTRRAVQRIVREIGDFRGVPLAIDGLTDEDSFVRSLAAEALAEIFPTDIDYRADAPESDRALAQALYRERWLEARRSEFEEAIAGHLRAMTAR